MELQDIYLMRLAVVCLLVGLLGAGL